MRKWRIEDSEELYNINGWGVNYFGINEKGNVYVTPRKDSVQVDLKELVNELALHDVSVPVLLRFPDILDNRIEKTSTCFEKAAKEYDFKAENFIIYPIKVNQMRPVVEEIISHGKKFNLGLEAGSKPELHAVIAVNTDSDSPIICNGYKDQNYISESASNWPHQEVENGKKAAVMPASSVLLPVNCLKHSIFWRKTT